MHLLKNRKNIVLILFFIVSANSYIWADEQDNFSLLLVNQGEPEDIALLSELSPIIYREYKKMMSFTVLPWDQNIPFVESRPTEFYLSEARSRGILFLAINTYTLNDDTLTINSIVLQSGDDNNLFNTVATGALSLGIERKISFIVHQTEISIKSEIAQKGEEVLFTTQTELKSREVKKIEIEEEQFEIIPQSPANPIVSTINPVPDSITVPENSSDLSPVKFISGLNISPFFPIADATEYMDIGVTTELFLGASFDLERIIIQSGINLGILSFEAQGIENSSLNILGSFGVEGRFLFLPEKLINPFISVGGGGTIYNLRTASGIWLSKWIPYATASTGINIDISSHFSISTGIDVSFYFEQSLMIIGLKPFIGVSRKW